MNEEELLDFGEVDDILIPNFNRVISCNPLSLSKGSPFVKEEKNVLVHHKLVNE